MAVIKCEKIENGIRVNFPTGEHFDYKVYPFECNDIPIKFLSYGTSDYNIMFSKKVGNRSTAKGQKELFNTLNNLRCAHIEVKYFHNNTTVANKVIKYKLIIELLYKKGALGKNANIASNLWNSRQNYSLYQLSTKQISNLIASFTDVADLFAKASKLEVNNCHFKYPIIKEYYQRTRNEHYSYDYNVIKKYEKEIYNAYKLQPAIVKKVDAELEELKTKLSPTMQKLICIQYETQVIPCRYNANGKLVSNPLDATVFYNVISTIIACYELTKKLNIPISRPEKSYTEWQIYRIQLEREYESKRTEIEEKIFKDNQSKIPAWFYENENGDTAKLIIPTTRKECVEIGNSFNNCFGGMEWNSNFATGTRYGAVLCINNQPTICMDIDVSDNTIRQWLTYNNQRTSAYDNYKALLQEHFNKIRREG